MKRKDLVLSILTAGIAGMLLANHAGWAQDGNECSRLWMKYGCWPQSSEGGYVVDHARECQESWRSVATVAETTAAPASLQADTYTMEPAVMDPAIIAMSGAEDGDYWYDGETRQYHRYHFADETVVQVVPGEDTPADSTEALASDASAMLSQSGTDRGDYDDLFDMESTSSEEQPAMEEVDQQAWDVEPLSTPSPEVLLTVARALDRTGSVLQSLSRRLTQMADQELAKASGGTWQR